jgi:predicted GH43/DUF377 family glycosyl hydrolase
MLKLSKFEGNPIIVPRKDKDWEVGGTFNPGAVSNNDEIHILYRAVDGEQISRLGYAQTRNGTEMTYRSPEPVMNSSGDNEEFGCEDPRITKLDGQFYITYTAFSRRGPRIAMASTNDFRHFEKYGYVGPDLNDKDCVIFPERIDGKITLLHRLESRVQIAHFDSIESLIHSEDYWKVYVRKFNDFEVFRSTQVWEARKVGVGPPPIRTPQGWLVIYHGVSLDHIYRAGAVLLDLDNPVKVVARTKEPILEPEKEFERLGVVPNVVFPDGAVVLDGMLLVYYGGADNVCCVASAPLDDFIEKLAKAT